MGKCNKEVGGVENFRDMHIESCIISHEAHEIVGLLNKVLQKGVSLHCLSEAKQDKVHYN